jgi:FecR protein
MTRLLRSLGTRSTLTITCALVAIGVPAHAWGQPPDNAAASARAADPPAHVAFVDGAAVLERDGHADPAPANMPLLAGDRLRTQEGRVEILFTDGSTLHLDTHTTLDFQSDELVRLLAGRIRLAIPGRDRQVSYRIDTPPASAVILQTGEYKVTARPTRDCDVELAVLRGAADLVNDAGRTALRAGEQACARASAAPSYAYAFNSAAWDAFDRWSETRRDQRLGVSAQYLPDEVRSYAGAFDQYGSWQYQPTYGYVWYPSVAAGWRPYHHGRWVTMRPYGWTWVGTDPFAWPTHHYGRWGFSSGVWFWIPGHTWGPAWVSWAYAPGYVSWCPLGWNNQAVIGINFYSGAYYPWHAWTVVPRPYFGVGYVHAHYVPHVAPHVWQTFTPRYTAPAGAGYAVPRSAAPIRVPGTVTPRRSPSTVYTNLEPRASRVPLGGQRVVIGEPRSSVAPQTSFAVPRGTTGDVSRRSAEGSPSAPPNVAEQQRRSLGIAGVPSIRGQSPDDANVQRAMPRDAGMYRTPVPSYGFPITARPQGAEGQPGRSPVGAEAARPPAYGGFAVPRAGSNPGSGSGSRPGSFGPPAGAPQGSPPAQPSGAGDHRGPGNDRGQPAPPPAGGAGGHSRGGAPATGQAVPRGRG